MYVFFSLTDKITRNKKINEIDTTNVVSNAIKKKKNGSLYIGNYTKYNHKCVKRLYNS